MTDDDFEAGLQRRKQQREERARKMRGWLIGVGLAVAVVAAARALFGGQSDGGSVAFNIGQAFGGAVANGLIIAGLGYLALWLMAGRRLKAEGGGGRFGLLFLIAVLVGAPLSLLQSVSSNGFERSVTAISTEERARLDTEMALLKERERPLLSPLPLSGEMLGQPDGLPRARAALTGLREIQRERARLAAEASERVRVRVQALEGASSSKAKVEDALRADEARMNAMVAASVQVFDKGEAQLDILARSPGRWTIQSGQVAFARQADLEAFNRIQLEIEALQARMEALSKDDQSAPADQSPEA